MPHKRKVVRTKRLYKKHTVNKRVANMVYFVLLIIVLVGLGYIVSLEWSKRFGPNAPSSVPQSSAPSVITSSDQASSEESSEEVTSSEPATSISGVKAAFMPVELLNSQNLAAIDSYLTGIKAEGYNAVNVELKTEDGKIHYLSANEMAKKFEVITPQAVDINVLVEKIKSAGLTPIAAMSTLKDAASPHVKNENSYCYNGNTTVNWLDNSFDKGGKPWLNPYMDNARNYISALAKEMSEAGFKTIILNNVMLPDKNTRSMGFVNQTKPYAEILAQLVTEVSAAVEGSEVIVSYISEQFINTVTNQYLVSAKDIGYKNAGLLIDKAAINRVLNSIKGTLDKGLTSAQQQEAALKALLDKAVADLGTDIIPIVEDKELLATIEPTLALYNFKNIFTGGK